MDASALLQGVRTLEKEKGIDANALFDAIESSFATACKHQYGDSAIIKCDLDRMTGEIKLFRQFEVVDEEDYVDPTCQITKELLKNEADKYQIGDIYSIEMEAKDFGRIAVGNAIQVIRQKIREAERRSIYDQFADKEHKIISGIVGRSNAKGLLINLGRTDAMLEEQEKVRTENYFYGSRIKVYVLEVKNGNRGPRILVSRSHPELIKKLFEAEVPEIANGIVEIKAIVREAGSRTKMAVWTNDPEVDPIGACVGVNGSRINAVLDELSGEKIDIINWDESSAVFIENAISPAKVICVLADDEERSAIVVVPDHQLSLSIGTKGQNARLAARLTGYKIDIKSETQARESGLFDEIGYIEDYYDEDGEYIGEEYEEGEDGEYAEGYTAEPEE